MEKKVSLDLKTIFLLAVIILIFWVSGPVLFQNSPKAFGGNFAPQMAQEGARYQISGCDANSAWVIDRSAGDVYLIYSNGKWKEVGSIMDEKKRMKR